MGAIDQAAVADGSDTAKIVKNPRISTANRASNRVAQCADTARRNVNNPKNCTADNASNG